MERKSLKSHQERRNLVNHQRGNTSKQRATEAIFDQLKDFPIIINDIVNYFNMTYNEKVILDVRKGLYIVSISIPNKEGELNKIKVILNNKLGTQSIKVDPQGENKENYSYEAKNISQEHLLDETKLVKTLLDTGELNPKSLLKKIDLTDMSDFVTEIDLKPFDQSLYDFILSEAGQSIAIRYAKSFLSKPTVDNRKEKMESKKAEK